jgi:hypothetical protein
MPCGQRSSVSGRGRARERTIGDRLVVGGELALRDAEIRVVDAIGVRERNTRDRIAGGVARARRGACGRLLELEVHAARRLVLAQAEEHGMA